MFKHAGCLSNRRRSSAFSASVHGSHSQNPATPCTRVIPSGCVRLWSSYICTQRRRHGLKLQTLRSPTFIVGLSEFVQFTCEHKRLSLLIIRKTNLCPCAGASGVEIYEVDDPAHQDVTLLCISECRCVCVCVCVCVCE
jgi:hypothetical protein